VGRTVLVLAVLVTVLTAVAPAVASRTPVARNATNVSLKVDKTGHAVVYYTQNGQKKHPLFWGAVNAVHSSAGTGQVQFKADYSGGWGSFKKPIWKTIKNVCGPYTGPELAWLVTACTAPDGSHWALQQWQKMLPNLGLDPWKENQDDWELQLSHWTGDLPVLEVYLDWAVGKRFHHLFGRLTYGGLPVHGFGASTTGNPTDDFGRNVYLDVFDSVYGPGWKRENSFLTHNPNGNFCYLFSQRNRYSWYPVGDRRGPANAPRYRMSVMGPGVTPIVQWQGTGLPDYDRSNETLVAHEAAMDALNDQFAAGDASRTPCTQN
jgi:hypothetical protein